MTLIDTTDGVFMVGAYGWAFANPERKLWYNLTMTAASILVAAMIGGVQVLGLLASKLNLTGMFWTKVQELNDDLVSFGLLVIGLFALSWIVSSVVFNFRFSSDLPATGQT
jgi:nickel/cobalt transporter (NiCoT) family protein